MKAFLPFSVRAAICSTPTLSPKQVEDRRHPARITAGQVIVDRDQVHALAGQGIQVHRQGRHQGLAFTGAHLSDLALVQHRAADQLDIDSGACQWCACWLHAPRQRPRAGSLQGFLHPHSRLRNSAVLRRSASSLSASKPRFRALISSTDGGNTINLRRLLGHRRIILYKFFKHNRSPLLWGGL